MDIWPRRISGISGIREDCRAAENSSKKSQEQDGHVTASEAKEQQGDKSKKNKGKKGNKTKKYKSAKKAKLLEKEG
ncbi:uncharacterized protein PG986_006759 [Apiospora aurea]|uniref:Uncharacterized protein n=1 Tax=Apiospora aurea TaxID=335848 RepID=A0ABR1QBB4_9PEZI